MFKSFDVKRLSCGKRKLIILGSPYWTRYLANLIEGSNVDIESQSIKRALLVVGVGGEDSWKKRIIYRTIRLAQCFGLIQRVVIYWIGSDVASLTNDAAEPLRCYRHIAGASILSDELMQFGVHADTVWFPYDVSEYSNIPFPGFGQGLRVLCYIPEERPALYGGSQVVQLAESFPNVHFTIVGSHGAWLNTHPNNLEFRGWVTDMVSSVAEHHLVLRLVAHDAYSASLRQAVAARRITIGVQDVAGVHAISHRDQEALSDIIRRCEQAVAEGDADMIEGLRSPAHVSPPSLEQSILELKASLWSL